jgi:NAD(P)-dependent dehydrogenase (short-subunit alcohol dehydrogenase family)
LQGQNNPAEEGNKVKVQGKVIVVTGAGNGMARDVTLQLLKAGASVAAVDLNEEMLKETEQLAGGPNKKLSLHVVNIADLAQVSALPAAVVKAHGHVDGLMNIAGIIHQFKKVADLSYEDFHRVFNVNFFGTVQMVKEFLPLLMKRPEAQILNISSMGSYVPVPGQTIYGASKAAIKLFTEGLRMELFGSNVGVALVFPGAVATNISTNSKAVTEKEAAAMADKAGSFKMTSSPDAAAKIIEGFEKNSYHGFAGADAQMMDRIARLAPEQAAKIIQKQMAGLLGD